MFWEIKNTLQQTSSEDRLKELVEYLLTSRGLTGTQSINDFLSPNPPTLDVINEFPDFDAEQFKKALVYIQEALKQKRPIIVYGDYDCDGVVATAILWEALYAFSPNVRPFIPNRIEHGYGLTQEGLTEALKAYPDQNPLIITVDNGITAHDVIKEFSHLDFIVTDHHQKSNQLPAAKFIIHTTKISGAGVSWVLASHLTGHPLPLDLLAIATVCDLLPLVGPNRSFVKFGLKQLQNTTRPGLVALKKMAGITPETTLDTYHLGFVIGPRINAAGRLGQGMDALRLLCTKNQAQADNLALLLNETNSDRQYLTKKHTDAVLKKLEDDANLPPVIILESTDYHEGIIGLIAGKVVERFVRPCLVLSVSGNNVKGSARSPIGVDITALLRTAGEGIIECGGHEQAAGLKMETKDLEVFKDKLLQVSQTIDPVNFKKILEIDARLENSDLNFSLLDSLTAMAPFGVGNPNPTFAGIFNGAKPRLVGRDQNHLSIDIPSDSGNLSAIGFSLGSLLEEIQGSLSLDIAFHLGRNSYMGREKLQLQIKDLKSAQKL